MIGAVISRFWLMLFPTQWNMAIVFRGLEQFYCCKGVIGGDEKFEVAIIAWSGRKVEFRKGDWRLKMRKGKRVKWNYIKVLHCFYLGMAMEQVEAESSPPLLAPRFQSSPHLHSHSLWWERGEFLPIPILHGSSSSTRIYEYSKKIFKKLKKMFKQVN